MKTEIKKTRKSEIEIIGTLEWSEFEKHEEKALKKIEKELNYRFP